ncbi:MAG: helix-turn-helix domain-containing protein [Clostridia bacterium]|nr:helix-turn-helix domain-containing protein [Clostridia bacterium]
MEYDIISLLDLIKEKTGKEVSVFSDIDEKFCSTDVIETIDRPDYKVTGVVSDAARGKTYFRFRYKAESLVGYIDGCGEGERLIAELSVALLENGVIKEKPVTRSETLRAIVLGEEKGVNIRKYLNKYSVPDGACTVYVITFKGEKGVDVLNFIENFKSGANDLIVQTDNNAFAYIKFNENYPLESEYQSSTDFAYLIVRSLSEELGFAVKVGIGGTAKSFSECAISYQQAVTAIRMGEMFDPNADVSNYKEYVLIKLLEDIPKYKLKEFLDILSEPDAKNIFGDEEMITTAEEFLSTSLNVSETARNLYMHRNTLMYRLDKIARSTGLDIRKFQDAVTFRILLILYKLLEV